QPPTERNAHDMTKQRTAAEAEAARADAREQVIQAGGVIHEDAMWDPNEMALDGASTEVLSRRCPRPRRRQRKRAPNRPWGVVFLHSPLTCLLPRPWPVPQGRQTGHNDVNKDGHRNGPPAAAGEHPYRVRNAAPASATGRFAGSPCDGI